MLIRPRQITLPLFILEIIIKLMKEQLREVNQVSPIDSADDLTGSLSEDKVKVLSQNVKDNGELITTIISSDGKEVKIWPDFDDSMNMANEAKDLDLTPEEDKKLVRKIDLHMFPLTSILYAIQYMDKTSNGNSAIMGLITDLKMVGDQYSWASSAFYFGYLGGLFVLPPLLQKSKYFMKNLSAVIIIWGLVLIYMQPLVLTMLHLCFSAVFWGF